MSRFPPTDWGFSILFTDAVHSHLLSAPHEDVSLAEKFFGGVFISCETLFRRIKKKDLHGEMVGEET